MQMDVLAVGDALIDIFLSINSADEHCHPNEDKSEICFIAGAKIPVDDCSFLLGGNACNISVGLSRLQVRTALAAEIGDDEFSHKIITDLQKENVDLTLLKQNTQQQTSFSIDLTFINDRTIFSRHVTRMHDLAIETINPSFLYLTSLGDEWKVLYQRVFTYSVSHNIKIAFNPGSKQFKAGVDKFKYMFAQTEILFINKEEAEEIIYGSDQNITEALKEPESLLVQIKQLGPRVVSMTDGKQGSYTIDNNGNISFQKVIPTTFVQKTGVGDAYASGFLAALLNGKGIPEAMVWGAINSSSVVSHQGAQGGLLTKAEILERMSKLNL